MHFKLCFAFLLALVHTLSGEPTPKFMGTLGSHSFYYDNEFRNWPESRSYCQSFGMDLADLPTLDHFQFLKDYVETDPTYNRVERHWTSAVHSMNVTQFYWPRTPQIPVSAELPSGGINGPQFCFIINNHRELAGRVCEDGQAGVICQT